MTWWPTVPAPATHPAERPATRPAGHQARRGAIAENERALRTMPRKWENVAQMHEYFVQRFINSDGFGYERMMTPRTMSHTTSRSALRSIA